MRDLYSTRSDPIKEPVNVPAKTDYISASCRPKASQDPMTRDLCSNLENLPPTEQDRLRRSEMGQEHCKQLALQLASLPAEMTDAIDAPQMKPSHRDYFSNQTTLFEQIEVTKPIWFLTHQQNRFQICQLLRRTSPGVFIVRSSSRAEAMALSVRMPSACPVEVEHYLIEQLPDGVRLEGSPNKFLSVSLLVHHYCQSRDEIQIRLQLPEAIRECPSTFELERLSLLKQDFWSSEMAWSRLIQMSQPSNDPTLMKMSQSMYGLAEHDNEETPAFRVAPRHRLATRLGVNALLNDYVPPECVSSNQKKRSIRMGVASGMLKKSYSAYGIAAALESDSRDHQSDSPSTSAKSKRPVNFLRNLFSTNDSQTNGKASKHEHQIRQPRTLTQTDDYFLPKATSSPTSKNRLWPQLSLEQQSSDSCSPSVDYEGANSECSLEHTGSKRSAERLLNASSSVGSRLKATFGTTAGKDKQCSDDEMPNSSNVDENDHQVLRRENTDLQSNQATSIASSSAAMPICRKSSMTEHHRRFHTSPIVPPHAGRMTSNAMQNCIEELRLRRNANGSTSSKTSSSHTDESDQHPNDFSIVLRSPKRPSQLPISRNMGNRMSVPNLSAAELSNNDSRLPNLKLGRENGELQTINEGLVTPGIVRRKYVNGNRQVVRIPFDTNTDCKNYPYQQHSRTTSAEQPSTQTQRQLAESLAAELSQLTSRKNKSVNQLDLDVNPSVLHDESLIRSQSVKVTTQSAGTRNRRPDELTPFVHKTPPWTAVNREFKSRQLQIAKVKPQPVTRTKQPASIGKRPDCELREIVQKTMSNGEETVGNKSCSTFDRLQTNNIDDQTSVSTAEETCKRKSSLPNAGHEDNREDQDDECLSTAGTVFNEPWDSNALENLLDIAQFCDERPSKAKAKAAYMECCGHETITEEEDNYSYCGSVSTASISPFSHVAPNPSSSTHNSNSDVEVHQVSLSPEDKVIDELNYQTDRPCSSGSTTNQFMSLTNNKIWTEMSKRIPSEPSTFDSRKDKRSRSLLNVASNQSPLVERQPLRSRAQTPGVFNHTTNLDEQFGNISSIMPTTSPARLRTTDRNADPGYRIQNFIERLAIDSTSTFGASLQIYIECTIDSESTDPRSVIRNARQFISGIKNFLTNGETIQEIIEHESERLRPDEFLNIDAILETVLHKIVLVPIKKHIYHIFCHDSVKNGSFETLTSNLALIRTFSVERFGFQTACKLPDVKALEVVRKYMRRMLNHYSPLKKFEYFLNALSMVMQPGSSTLLRGDVTKKLPCADIIRWMVFLLSKTSCVTCEIEACYMWELLPQQLLTTGHVMYYLSALFSAIHMLKNADSIERLRYVTEKPSFSTLKANLTSCIEEAADAYFRCYIPNEQCGNIEHKIFPLVAQLNVQRLCQIIANQLGISNNEEYGLFVLYDGYETPLQANDCPLTVRQELNSSGKVHFFAYKRIEAKIAWPSSAVQLTIANSLNQPIQGTFGSAQSRFV